MTDLGHTYEQMQGAQEEAAARRRVLERAYREVFHGKPAPDQQQMVREDLESFCGMRTALLRADFADTAHAVGMFRVWQRIVSFCFPRPQDASTSPGGSNGRSADRPIPGGGVAEQTRD
jgi:hypothetical protein